MYYWPGLVPVASGLCWLGMGQMHGWVLLLSLLPALLHIGTGMALLAWPGDRRIPQTLAIGSLMAMVMVLPVLLAAGLAWGLLLWALSFACFLVSGFAAIRHEPLPTGVPAFRANIRLAAWVALDEALLGYFTLSARMPVGVIAKRMVEDCDQIRQFNTSPDALGLYRPPSSLQRLKLEPKRSLGHRYEHLSFDSGYVPIPNSPGAEAWLELHRNRRAHAWVLKHPGPPRPWLVCIHGYRMGLPWMDFGLFRPQWLHHRLGLNLLVSVLPLHGPRRGGRRSGDGYLDGDFPNFIHAEAQAMHDIRSQIAWLRTEHHAPAVGVLGYSLGGYNAALLACLEDELACVIAGIPMTDIPATLWRHMPMLQLRYLDSLGLSVDKAREALRLVSPLQMPAKVNRRYIFAGLADRLIPPEQPLALAQHWDVDDVAWYSGTHLSFGNEAIVSRLILRALGEAGMLSGKD